MSDSANYKYRALVIQHPKLNHSGEYMCSVQTYESFDRKAARFQIVGRYSSPQPLNGATNFGWTGLKRIFICL